MAEVSAYTTIANAAKWPFLAVLVTLNVLYMMMNLFHFCRSFSLREASCGNNFCLNSTPYSSIGHVILL